jgi:hypothetical protein
LLRRRAVWVEESDTSKFGKVCYLNEILRIQVEGKVNVLFKVGTKEDKGRIGEGGEDMKKKPGRWKTRGRARKRAKGRRG